MFNDNQAFNRTITLQTSCCGYIIDRRRCLYTNRVPKAVWMKSFRFERMNFDFVRWYLFFHLGKWYSKIFRNLWLGRLTRRTWLKLPLSQAVLEDTVQIVVLFYHFLSLRYDEFIYGVERCVFVTIRCSFSY